MRATTGVLLLNRLFGNKWFILEKVTEALNIKSQNKWFTQKSDWSS